MNEQDLKLLLEILHAIEVTLSLAHGDLQRAPQKVTGARLYECQRLLEWAEQVAKGGNDGNQS